MRFLAVLLCLLMSRAWGAHAYAQFGDIKYPAGFSHFDYVNPAAPKGGTLSMVPPTRLSNFDKYNPFTLKGSAAPQLLGLVFETLLTTTLDEPTTSYGLLAEDIAVAPDRLSVVFRLNPKARFNNGDPVLAEDVKHSFDRLTSKEAAPQFRTIFADIASVTVLDERSVRFAFKRVNAELPLIAGTLPVFSRKWGMDNGKPKPLDKIVTDLPIGSGPYRIGKVNFGKDITYARNPDYWARDLNVRRGMFNFDRITFKIYKDNTVQLEALKAGEFDYMQAFSAREWARSYSGRPFDRGLLTKENLKHGNAGDFQGFLLNTRRPHLADARVRQAIALTMDYEWMNRQFFYNQYERMRGYFTASDFEARGKADGEEKALLEAWRGKLPDAVIDGEVPMPPVTSLDPASGITLRDNLRRARTLLTEAGWTYRDGALRNAKGQPLVIEFLDNSNSMSRIVQPWSKNLEKLGVQIRIKVVDFAILQKRLDVFDFDMVSIRTIGSESPGVELLERFGSRAAENEGSGNLMGVRDPVVDALLEKVVQAQTRPQLIAALRALDRVLRHGHYSVPAWYGAAHRVSYRTQRFERAKVAPTYYQPDTWITSCWWATPANIAEAAASTPVRP
ncbi:MAG: ABC transporter substrate-binding protein [Betaproteobacteria bacterium]|nr:ABC transporter substrate-binding protein [Betaproteobacteria bacterium]